MSNNSKRETYYDRRERELKEAESLLLKKQKLHGFLRSIPLFIAIIFLLLSAVMIYEAFRFKGDYCDFDWIEQGGIFFENDIKIGSLTLYWFFIISGLVFTFLVSLLRRKNYNYKILFTLFMPAFFFVQSLLGAKVLFAFEKAIENGSFAKLNFSGQSLFGSLYFALPLIPLVALIFKKDIKDLYDFVAPFWLVLLAFTRLGCFTSRCCGSKEFYIENTLILWPVQLFDAICALLLLWLCLKAESKESRKLFGLRPFNILLIGYGICRFMLEFIRTNNPLFYKLTISQYHCIIFIAVGLLMTALENKKTKQILQQ